MSPIEMASRFARPNETALRGIERAVLCEALMLTGGIQLRAARFLGITPRVMHYRMVKLDLYTFAGAVRCGLLRNWTDVLERLGGING